MQNEFNKIPTQANSKPAVVADLDWHHMGSAERHCRWYDARMLHIEATRGQIEQMEIEEMRQELLDYMKGSMTHYRFIRTPKGVIKHPVIFFWGEVMVQSDHDENYVLKAMLVWQRHAVVERHCRAKAAAWTRTNGGNNVYA